MIYLRNSRIIEAYLTMVYHDKRNKDYKLAGDILVHGEVQQWTKNN